MIEREDVVSGFLTACPSLRAGWEDRLRPEDVHGDAPTDIGYIGNHLAACYGRGETGEFPAAFAFLERCAIEGSDAARPDCVFVLFPLWLRLKKEPAAAKAFEEAWLGPYSQAAWKSCEDLAQMFERGFGPFLTHLRKAPEA